MTVKAELKSVQASKAVSQDMVYKFTFVTDDKNVLALGSLPADTIFTLEIDADE